MSGLQRERIMTALRIPIRVEERHGLARAAANIRAGVPLPKGLIRDSAQLMLEDETGQRLPHQFQTLAKWSDGSAKWILLDALVDVPARVARTLFVTGRDTSEEPNNGPLVQERTDSRVRLDAAGMHFTFDRSANHLFAAASHDAVQKPVTVSLVLADHEGRTYSTRSRTLSLEQLGSLTATVLIDGAFEANGQLAPIEFRARAALYEGASRVALDVQLRNPQAAHHVGGLWDLGDPGSFFIRDCTVRLRVSGESSVLQWSANAGEPMQAARGDWSLYQDSSGGERWNSINHVDARGNLTVAFRGYEIAGESRQVVNGRASPSVCLQTDSHSLAVTVPNFWQEFPKALRRRGQDIEIGLFPRECAAGFELQAGERKRHSMIFEVAGSAHGESIRAQHLPLSIAVDPRWVERTAAVAYFTAQTPESPAQYQQYVGSIIDGPQSFFNKREQIDEYGWRNFGDLYADHEAVKHQGTEPFISHYNNQYDFIYGAAVHYLRTGDDRWRQLMQDAARHTLDIDIYHTRDDKPAFNGGLFWHTDHYVPAATCTHRTYSSANARDGSYGGGPANEHNYTSGLLHYYYLSGDLEAKDAVLTMADWVIAMDDGTGTLLGFICASPVGLASQTVDVGYHKPGRGAGNSINALLDAYAVSGLRHYMLKAEELVQRVIHPRDDIAALQLGEPEHRWSYLAFLQVLGKYVAMKAELGERDYGYHYARESLLAYAEWMLAHEVPYKDVLDKVLIPTETWPAQDIRKAHVLYMAAQYSGNGERTAAFRARAQFFYERCVSDLLSFQTAYLTRPQVLLCVYGYVHEYFQGATVETAPVGMHNYDFGEPSNFQPQRQLFSVALRGKRAVARREFQRMAREAAHRIKCKLGRAKAGRN
ncbi:MAG: hypothetical protein ABW110_18310 [Steroidobacteraceae bacterium]